MAVNVDPRFIMYRYTEILSDNQTQSLTLKVKFPQIIFTLITKILRE